MSKADDLLNYMLKRPGEWCCAFCGSNSGQPAAIFRELKKRGYQFEETTPGRWAKDMFCPVCKENRTHYKLLSAEPVFEEKPRIGITGKMRKHILELFGGRDAFTGASISYTPEIDHKTPWTRLDHDVDTAGMSDTDIRKNFQLLTREHNLLKDRMCGKCKLTNIRPPFLEIPFWYEGDEHYCGTCKGCGWYDGVKWREEVAKRLK